MRLKTRICLVVGVLLIGALAWWRHEDGARRAPEAAATPFALRLTNAQPAGPAAVPANVPGQLTGAAANIIATNLPSLRVTNALAFRLSNSPASLEQLAHDDRAILLRHALIDTRRGAPMIPWHLRALEEPGSYIVQAYGAITREFRDMIEREGGKVISYIPNNAYLVRASAASIGRITRLGWAQAVLPFEPYYKFDSRLLPVAVKQELSPFGRLNVVSFPGEGAAAQAALEKLGATVVAPLERSALGDILVVKAPANALPALARIPEVQLLGVSSPKRPANDLGRVKLRISTNTTVAPPASHYPAPGPTDYLTGQGVLVGVTDTGVDDTHPDLAGRVFGATVDFEGHGTHVIGSILGNGSQSGTVGTVDEVIDGVTNSMSKARGSTNGANFSGMAPSAQAFVQLLNTPNATLQQETALRDILISNNSWGYPEQTDYDIAAASFDAAVRDSLPGVTGEQQVAYVFSAGNNGGGSANGQSGLAGSINSPATAKNVITVGAADQLRRITNEVTRNCFLATNAVSGPSGTVTNVITICITNTPWLPDTDSDNQISTYSSRGNVGIGVEGPSGRFKPDVVAPGSMVVSTRSVNYTEPEGSTNNIPYEYNGLTVAPGATNLYAVTIPANAISVTIATLTNLLSPANMTLAIGAAIDIIPAADTGFNLVTLTPPTLTAGTLYYNIANTLHPTTVNFDLLVIVTLTNDLGNYFVELKRLNDEIKPYYRYESGTSMAAPMVSGMAALIQEYLQANFSLRPSPALLKALLINGARSLSLGYDLDSRPTVNHQGWGLANLSNSIPSGLTQTSNGPMRFFEQNTTNALETGGTDVYQIAVPDEAKSYPLRVTLVWTDPSGNPASSIKLVNDLNLAVYGTATNAAFQTNSTATTNTSELVWLGNNFKAGSDFSSPIIIRSTDTNAVASTNLTQDIELASDTVNNVENVYLRPPLSSSYTIVVKGHRVNVNAINSRTNGIAQDYALVVSSGNVSPSNSVNLVVAGPTFTNDFAPRLATLNPPGNSNAVSGGLFNQRVGANSALIVSTNGATNQWGFFTYTNTTRANFTNVVILTFLAQELSLPRFRDADIDLYVARGAGARNLFDLDPDVVTNSTRSVSRGGSEFLLFNDAAPGEVFYIGVKSEDQQAANFSIYAASSDRPFSFRDASNNIVSPALFAPVPIPDGSPDQPGGTNLLAIVFEPNVVVRRVYVTNSIYHEEAGDLIGILSHRDPTDGNDAAVTLNNHRTWNGLDVTMYDDSDEGDLGTPTSVPPTYPADGPGSLRDFVGQQAFGIWTFNVSDNANFHTGSVEGLTLVIEPASTNNNEDGVLVARRFCIQPGRWITFAANVDSDAFNLETCLSQFEQAIADPIAVYIRNGSLPDFNNYDHHFDAMPPGQCYDIGLADNPPLVPGRYYYRLFNSNAVPVCFFAKVTQSRRAIPDPFLSHSSEDTPLEIPDNAQTNSSIFVPEFGKLRDIQVGLRVDHERASDLVFHLVSPSGTRTLLAENRGGPNGSNYGGGLLVTNVLPVSSSGGPAASTNVINTPVTEGIILISREFYNIPDRMTIYYEGRRIYDSTLVSGAGNVTLNFGPGTSTNVTIIMNERNNNDPGTLWDYTATIITGYRYATFTENTNLTATPIKFGIAPFTNAPNPNNRIVLDDGFENLKATVAGRYCIDANSGEVSGWHIDTNSVDFVGAPIGWPVAHRGNWAIDINGCSQSMISTNVTTEAGADYQLSFAYLRNPSAPFDPQVRVSVAGSSTINTLDLTATVSNVWSITSFVFQAQSDVTKVIVESLTPGIGGVFLDSFIMRKTSRSGDGVPFYLPEESLKPFIGEEAHGEWRLEVWDSRGGGTVNAPQLLNWRLQLGYGETNPSYLVLTNNQTILTNLVGEEVLYVAVEVPCGAGVATNILRNLTGNGGLELTFNQFTLPTNGPADVVILTAVTNTGSTNLTIGSPPLVAATRYYLAVRNQDPNATNSFTLTVNFACSSNNIIVLDTNAFCNLIAAAPTAQFYQFNLGTNVAFFQVETFNASGNVDLGLRFGALPSPGIGYESSRPGTTNESIVVGTSSAFLFPAQPGPWFIRVDNREAGLVAYCLKVTVVYSNEIVTLPLNAFYPSVGVTNVASNGLRYYRVILPSSAVDATFSLLLTNGDADLYLSRATLPTTNVYNYASLSNGPVNESIFINSPPAIGGDWYLAVRNMVPSNSTYRLRVDYTSLVFLTNNRPYTNLVTTSPLFQQYGYNLNSNALQLTFEVQGLGTNNVDMYARGGRAVTNAASADYLSVPYALRKEYILINTTSAPVPLNSVSRWYANAVGLGTPSTNALIKATEVVSNRVSFITPGSAPVTNHTLLPYEIDYFVLTIPTNTIFNVEARMATGSAQVILYNSLNNFPTTTWNERFSTRNPDPFLAWNTPTSGTLHFAVANASPTAVADYYLNVVINPVPFAPAMKVGVINQNQVNLKWAALGGLRYEVQAADALDGTNWQTLSGGVSFDGENFEFTDLIGTSPTNRPKRFYRLIQLP